MEPARSQTYAIRHSNRNPSKRVWRKEQEPNDFVVLYEIPLESFLAISATTLYADTYQGKNGKVAHNGLARQSKPAMAQRFTPEAARPSVAPMAPIMPQGETELRFTPQWHRRPYEPPAPLRCTLTLTGITPTGTRTEYGYWNGQRGYWNVVSGRHVFMVVN